MKSVYEFSVSRDNVLHVTDLKNPLNFHLHFHLQFELLYVYTGSINVEIAWKSFTATVGDIVLIDKNQIHSYQSSDDFTGFLMIFSGKVLPSFDNLFRNKKIVENKIESGEKRQIFEFCTYNIMLNEERKNNDPIKLGYIFILLGEIMEMVEVADENKIEDSTVLKIINYVNDNYDKDIELESIAKHVGLSKFHISKLFNKKIGCSLNKYVNILRIEKAKEMLIHGNSKIETAYECGFGSVRSFYRTFKEVYGKTPGDFEKENIV